MNEFFASPEHALKTGLLLGWMMQHGIEVWPIMDGSDYTPRVTIVDKVGRRYRIEVLPDE